MPIPFKKYIQITSAVGGGAAVRTRDLIGRLFTSSNLLPPGTIMEFTTAAAVLAYFGSASEEYKRAVLYFSFISKNATQAQKISYARWVESAVAPMVFGVSANYPLANFTSISSGSLGITMGAYSTQLTSIDLSAAASLADVASAIQTKVRAYTTGGALFTSATVTYDVTRKSFNLVGGATGDAPMEIVAGTTGTDVASRLGWLTGSIQAEGSAVETITNTLTNSTELSNNFGSFLFMPSLSDDEADEAAAWNALQNVMFIDCLRTTAADAQDYYDLLKGYAGLGISLAPLSTQYPEMCPMIVLAATDYTRRNAVQNYEFQIFPTMTPSVTTGALSDLYDNIRINYVGQTQQAGEEINFYQQGVLMGGDNDPVDMNTYANEIWLKDYIGAALMSLLLSMGRVPANAQGRGQVMAIIQSSIELALFNGTISVGKPLDAVQITYIGSITNDPTAWQQVQNIGYWFDVTMQKETDQSGKVIWKAVYTLIYSKDDAVRKVVGSHILI